MLVATLVPSWPRPLICVNPVLSVLGFIVLSFYLGFPMNCMWEQKIFTSPALCCQSSSHHWLKSTLRLRFSWGNSSQLLFSCFKYNTFHLPCAWRYWCFHQDHVLAVDTVNSCYSIISHKTWLCEVCVEKKICFIPAISALLFLVKLIYSFDTFAKHSVFRLTSEEMYLGNQLHWHYLFWKLSPGYCCAVKLEVKS